VNICFVASRFPYPVTKGDSLRAYHQIRELSREHRVALISAVEHAPSAEALATMTALCESVETVTISRTRSLATVASRAIGSPVPLQVLYFVSEPFRRAVRRALARERFDIVHAMMIRVAPAVLPRTGPPVVVDFMDSYAANIATRREHVAGIVRSLYDLEGKRVARYERDVARQADGGVVIAEFDRKIIGDSRLAVVPNGVDTETLAFYSGEREPATLVFTGNMGYHPNVDAVTWFAGACLPALRARYHAVRLMIVGARPAARVTALARLPGIEVTGQVESMAPYLRRATVAVCPIRCGSDMQNKVLEAMAAGVPVVTTDFANRSVAATPGAHVQVAADAASMTSAISRLLSDESLRARQAIAARTFVESTYSWAQHGRALVAAYERAIDVTRGDLLTAV